MHVFALMRFRENRLEDTGELGFWGERRAQSGAPEDERTNGKFWKLEQARTSLFLHNECMPHLKTIKVI